MGNHKTEKFIEVYQSLNKDNLCLLNQIYHQDITFKDPLHQVTGLTELTNYFSGLYSNLSYCQFTISDAISTDDKAFVYWTMQYVHPKLNGAQQISVEGHSHLQFVDEKIISHRDYFDVGALLYRHVPLLGSVINYIDKRAAQS
ncbi:MULTISPECIES: nuclear transport factor 2 family protein [Pseudoalteromonas]|uniref:Nuclear transport factor 2 family protein n=1 Tax=Pseudoalteromonas haloplanktis TaxID=228 RepID=A0ABU1B6J6_PSEHA|nr:MULTISPECIES: nuclear transport factor 2 family protein [Pseudoalteromonas]MCF6146879.1 hypothetical protein [Pseudoalteromonas mariniglutinosa NCIMB 1770]MDQ9089980.1 nuclear transport factor 2 family protein [Pseudoalteromonas haloplanktis]TMN73330.1 nuclear transport factor 2 family protein [Pseudoalteromonas sp. S1727]